MKKICALILTLAVTITALLCTLPIGATAEGTEVPVHLWDFELGVSGWTTYIDNKVAFTVSQGYAQSNALSFEYTYSVADSYNWEKSPIFTSPQYYNPLGDATHICFDVYVEQGKATTGSLAITPTVQSPTHNYWFSMNSLPLNLSQGEAVENNLLKFSYSVELVNSAGDRMASSDIINYIVFTNCGVATDYSGKIMYDNIRFVRYESNPEPVEFSLESVSLGDTLGLAAGDTITAWATATGGTAPYYYTYYATKAGKIVHKSQVWTTEATEQITLEEAGDYRILVYCRDACGAKRSIINTVSVANEVVKPTKISLSSSAMGLERGGTAYLIASVAPYGAVNKNVTWTSDNASVATVDQTGTVKGVGEGTANITAATYNGLTAVCTVTVTSAIPAADKYIALTFDDGPDANTGVILDTLAQYNAKSTFFVLHTNAQYNTALVQRMANEGHELGNHTKTHPYLTQLSVGAATEEIEFVNDFIYDLTGITPTLYRPPYFDYNSTVLSTFPNMTAIGCSIDTRDWSGISAEQIVSGVVNYAKDGDIVLMHVTQPNTRAALPQILEGLSEKGFACVTVSSLFELKGKAMNTGAFYSSAR